MHTNMVHSTAHASDARLYAIALTAIARSVGEIAVPGFDAPVVDGCG